MIALANHTALKEWSNVIDALGQGSQIVLLRKGGIADATFGIEAERFYLYPTYFHQGETAPRPSVTITHWCEVVKVLEARDAGELRRLERFVVIPRDTLEARGRFRPDQALRVIGVRTFALAQPANIAFRDAYGGCLSWISLDEEIDVTGSVPVLDERTLQARLQEVTVELAPVTGASG
jgi:hypothetical protein